MDRAKVHKLSHYYRACTLRQPIKNFGNIKQGDTLSRLEDQVTYRINWRIRYVSYSDIAYLTGHSILSIRAILSYTRGQTLPASGSYVSNL